MGFINDIIIAKPEEAQSIADSLSPTEHWIGAQDLGLDDEFLLGRLYCLLIGIFDLEEATDKTTQDYADDSQGLGTSAIVLSEDFVSSLAALDSERQTELARAWAESEEMKNMDRTPDETEKTFFLLCKLAQQAHSQQKTLISWVGK